MYLYIGGYIIYLCHNHKERIVYISGKQLPDDGFPNQYNSILLPFVHDPHRNHFLYPSSDDSSDTKGGGENLYIDPEQHPVRIRIYGTPHLDSILAGKPCINKSFNIFDDEID